MGLGLGLGLGLGFVKVRIRIRHRVVVLGGPALDAQVVAHEGLHVGRRARERLVVNVILG